MILGLVSFLKLRLWCLPVIWILALQSPGAILEGGGGWGWGRNTPFPNVIVLITLGLKKLNMAGMWPWIPKKLLKWEKAKKHTFSFKAVFVHFFFKVNFLIGPAQSCCHCGQFDIGVTICVWWLATPLN